MEFGDCTRVYKEHNHGVHQIFENKGLGMEFKNFSFSSYILPLCFFEERYLYLYLRKDIYTT